MKNRDKLIIVSSTLALTAIIMLLVKRKRDKEREKLDTIAEEGYETAEDILFPLKLNRTSKLRSAFTR